MLSRRSKKKQLKHKKSREPEVVTVVNQSQQTDLLQEDTKPSTTTTTTEFTVNSQSTSTSVPTPSSPSPPSKVLLASNDGRVFTVEVEVARLFGIVRTMLDDSIITSGVDEVEAVPLVHVSGPILELVVKWAKHHQNKNSIRPEQLKQEGSGESVVNSRGYHFDQGAYSGQPSLRSIYDVDPWDSQFLGALTPAKLQAVLEAANYLNIQQLLDSACKMIAQMIKGALESPDGPEEVTSLMQIPVPPLDEERRRKKCRSNNMVESFSSSAASLSTESHSAHSLSSLPVASTSETAATKSAMKIKKEEDREVRWVPLTGVFKNSGQPTVRSALCTTCQPSTSAAAAAQLAAEAAAPDNAAPAVSAPKAN